MTHELRHRHIGKLRDLGLFVLGILARVSSHIWVLSALDWRELIVHSLTTISVVRRPRLFGLSSERRMIQVIILWLLQVIVVLVLVEPVHALVVVIGVTSTLLQRRPSIGHSA